jgi:hypothetical protein
MQKFTPIFDEVCQHAGLVSAAVYGVVWRYCQMSEHVCYATLANIGLQAGVNRRTAVRSLAALEQQGWIVDLTPTYRNVPHVYQVTNRLAQSEPFPAPADPPAVTPAPSAVTDSPSGDDTLSPQAVTHTHPVVTHTQRPPRPHRLHHPDRHPRPSRHDRHLCGRGESSGIRGQGSLNLLSDP